MQVFSRPVGLPRIRGLIRWVWPRLPRLGRLPMTYEILKQAGETGRLVEVVFGAAPGWSDPWSRGRLCRVLALGLHMAKLRGEDGEFEVPTDEIAAVRIVDGIDTPV